MLWFCCGVSNFHSGASSHSASLVYFLFFFVFVFVFFSAYDERYGAVAKAWVEQHVCLIKHKRAQAGQKHRLVGAQPLQASRSCDENVESGVGVLVIPMLKDTQGAHGRYMRQRLGHPLTNNNNKKKIKSAMQFLSTGVVVLVLKVCWLLCLVYFVFFLTFFHFIILFVAVFSSPESGGLVRRWAREQWREGGAADAVAPDSRFPPAL
jgi:hypothetical protein